MSIEVVVTALVSGMIGTVVGVFMAHSVIKPLREAQLQYIECLQVGAPKDNCAKRYLLPQEPRT